MNYVYTRKLAYNIIRCINSNYKVFHFIHKKLKYSNGLRHYNLPRIHFYSTLNVDPNNVLPLTQYLKNTKLIDSKEFDNILSVNRIANLSQEQRTLLIRCCGKLLSNRTLEFRVQLCNIVFQKLNLSNCLSTEDYNAYIKVSTENEEIIECAEFLKSMKSEPNEETFKLLLENVSDKGDINQAYDILSWMKSKNYAVDERVFNALVLVHTIKGGLTEVESVLTTMKATHISQTSDTNWNILLGLAVRQNYHDFLNILDNTVLTFNEENFMKLLLKLGLNDDQVLIKKLQEKFDLQTIPPHLEYYLQHLCIHLLHRKKPETAFQMYSAFTEPNVQGAEIVFLEEMLECDTGISKIINICKYLSDTGRNVNALECITEMALKKYKYEKTWLLLEHFDVLRPHYFWPLLISAGKEDGEIGVLNALKKMSELKVELTSETLETYILPFCDISSPESFLLRTKHLNVPLRQLVTPMFVILLKNQKIKEIHELYDKYEVPLEGSRLMNPLRLFWKNTKDVKCVVRILRRIRDTNDRNVHFIGNITLYILKLCNTNEDYEDFLNFLKMLRKENLVINSLTSESIRHILLRKNDCTIREKIVELLSTLQDTSIEEENTVITHPKNMTIDELECHLTELTSKNMETRGVLRRLIQSHARLSNYSRIEELSKLVQKNEYEESPGMTSILLYADIKTQQCEAAMVKYKELQMKHPNFKVDDFKLIDLATLLVSENKFDVAMSVLKERKERSQKRDSRERSDIVRNCHELLNAVKTPEQAITLFQCLLDHNFCKPENFILGSIVRSYLKRNDYENAVGYYEYCCKNYKCTPLQVEILERLIDVQDELLLQRALDATATVHGGMKTQVSFAIALAEMGKTKLLTSFLLSIKRIPNQELQNRSNWWIASGKLAPLVTLLEAVSRLPPNTLDLNIIHMAIIQIFDKKNDCEGVSKFMKNLKENEVIVSEQMINIFNNLMSRNSIVSNDKMSNVNK